MNFRQIKLLNDLEKKVTFLEREVVALNAKIAVLENPPKRPRGRPRKIQNVN